MRTAGFFAGALCLLSSASLLQAQSSFSCAGYQSPPFSSEAAAKSLAAQSDVLPAHGQVHALVVFAQFRDQAPSPLPDFAEDLFDPHLPGSLAHFYHTMSFGQLQLTGTVLTQRYTAERPASSYLTQEPGEQGLYGRFALEILHQVDADLDFGSFDSDGPDNVPNSGDDDGVVDYVFIIVPSVPRGFIRDGATGVAGLGFEGEYSSADASASSGPLRLSNSPGHGALLRQGTFAQTVGSMAHEFGHGLGLPDLYDRVHRTPAEDSAGIGKWGLMGLGAQGWNNDDGPNPLCAWSREQLGWVGRDNEQLVELRQEAEDLPIADLHQGGYVYKIPLRVNLLRGRYYEEEYLLLEQRTRSSHYNRHLPAEGLLVWHIRPYAHLTHSLGHNGREEKKAVDLVCADGLYADAGYPLGRKADPYGGGDNLDFWAHEETYRTTHGGNLGDATDPFDGRRYARLDLHTNPSTAIGEPPVAASTGLRLVVQSKDNALSVDIRQPRWAGTIRQEVRWLGEILVDGDLTIAPEGRLVVHDNTRVRFAGTDRLHSGQDPLRCELRVQGELRLDQSRLYRLDQTGRWQPLPSTGMEFATLVPGESWYGVLVDEAAMVQVPEGSLVLRDAEYNYLETGLASERALQATVVLNESVSATFRLLPNFPNPFNAETAIRYALPEETQVQLGIYNALGQKVLTLVDSRQLAGIQMLMWDGRDERGQELASGVYWYQVQAGQQVETRQLLLLR